MPCRRLACAGAVLLLLGAPARAQTPQLPPSPPPGPDAGAPPGAPGPPAAEAPEAREFCHQPVSFRLAPRDAVAEQYRDFIGVWSDAAWSPQLCAALVVEAVQPDGTATIIYAFGPQGASAHGPGGVLNGTGIIRNGELKFQNSDGSQYAFKPFYSDLDGHLVTPKGEVFETIFKRTY